MFCLCLRNHYTNDDMMGILNKRHIETALSCTLKIHEKSLFYFYVQGTEDEEVFVESVKEAGPPKPPTLQFK